MVCVSCGASNAENLRICGQCGKGLLGRGHTQAVAMNDPAGATVPAAASRKQFETGVMTPPPGESQFVTQGISPLSSPASQSSVQPGSSGDEAGLRSRDVILEVNRAAVKDVDAYQAALKTSAKGKIVLLLVRRGDNTIYVTVKPEA